MILQAGYDCYLTQAEDMPLSERRFENQVVINSPEDVAVWKEITSKQKEQMIAEASFIGVPHAPSDADAATFCDIHIAVLVAFVCHPPVVPFPVGTEGWEVLSL